MFKKLEKFKVCFIVTVVWRLLPSKKIEMIKHYESTEDDSAWQLLLGMKNISNPSQKAELFAQAMEEAHHAELFRKLYQYETGLSIHKIFYPKKALYNDPSNMWRLFIYCLVGEEAAAQRFDYISEYLEEGLMKKTLSSIVQDEIGHIHKAKELIKVEGQSKQVIHKEINSIKLARFKESWLRSGRQITTLVTDFLLTAIYIIFVPIFSLTNRKGSSK
jgi:rubrerythrin